MARKSEKTIEVALNAKKLPAAFEWRGVRYRIGDIQEIWRLVGAWWDGEGERTFFRIRTDKGGIYELCFDHKRSAWSMSGVQD
jgi:hypothetical protein